MKASLNLNIRIEFSITKSVQLLNLFITRFYPPQALHLYWKILVCLSLNQCKMSPNTFYTVESNAWLALSLYFKCKVLAARQTRRG